jgi:hypothetical protein
MYLWVWLPLWLKSFIYLHAPQTRPRAQIPCRFRFLKVIQVVGAIPSDISDLPRSQKYKGVHLHVWIAVRPTHVPHYLPQKCDLYPTPEGGYFNLKEEGVHLMEFHVSVATQWRWGFQAPPTQANWFNRNGAGVGFHGTLFARAAFRCAEQTAHSPMPGLW